MKISTGFLLAIVFLQLTLVFGQSFPNRDENEVLTWKGYPTPFLEIEGGDQDVLTSDPGAKFSCRIYGINNTEFIKTTVVWLRDGNEIRPGINYFITTFETVPLDSTLVELGISQCELNRLERTSTFTCFLRGLGSDTRKLRVNGYSRRELCG